MISLSPLLTWLLLLSAMTVTVVGLCWYPIQRWRRRDAVMVFSLVSERDEVGRALFSEKKCATCAAQERMVERLHRERVSA